MKIYVANSESVSQSSDALKREIDDLKEKLQVSYFTSLKMLMHALFVG